MPMLDRLNALNGPNLQVTIIGGITFQGLTIVDTDCIAYDIQIPTLPPQIKHIVIPFSAILIVENMTDTSSTASASDVETIVIG